MVVPGGARDTAKENLGGYIMGVQEKVAEQEGHVIGARSGGGDSRGRRAGVWILWGGYG